VPVKDLGAWWKDETGLPLPLQVFLDRGFEAGIVPRRVELDFVEA
jgi:predicted solute-binding protein